MCACVRVCVFWFGLVLDNTQLVKFIFLAPTIALFLIVTFESANTLYKPMRLDKLNKLFICEYSVIALCCFVPPIIWNLERKKYDFEAVMGVNHGVASFSSWSKSILFGTYKL